MQRSGKIEEAQVAGALALLKKLPPQDLEKNLASFSKVAPHLSTSLQPYITKPSSLVLDTATNKFFLACEYNNDGNAYRSPWTNVYHTVPAGGKVEEDKLFHPPADLRRLEEMFNEVFDAYKTSYYEGGVSSVYLWDLEDGFAAAFLIRKEVYQSRGVENGIWDIVHLAEVRESPNTNFAEYRVYSNLLLSLELAGGKAAGTTELGAYFTRQAEDKRKKTNEDAHLPVIGRMIEEMEISLRQSLDSFYMAKHREVLSNVRSLREDIVAKAQPVLPKAKTAIRGTGTKNMTFGTRGSVVFASQEAKPS